MKKTFGDSPLYLLMFFFLFAFSAIATLILSPSVLNAQQLTAADNGNSGAPVTGKSPFETLKKTYANIFSLEASFHQKVFVSGIRRIREFEGDFFFKRQKGFLWKYRKPKVKIFLFDGRYMWQDEEEKAFVLKNSISREKTGGTFFDLIEDIERIDDLFTVAEHSMTGGAEYFELIPKKDSSVTLAKLWVDTKSLLRKIEITEFTGNINTIEFTDIRVNTPVSDTKFIYRADGTKDVIER